MSNNLPSKYEHGIVFKIKRFFMNLFKHKENVAPIEKIEVVKKEKNEQMQDDVFSQMREGSKKTQLKEEILTIIDNKPELINTMSLKQLEEVSNMYEKIIETNNKKINKLKRALA